jgi:hypothetical protein
MAAPSYLDFRSGSELEVVGMIVRRANIVSAEGLAKMGATALPKIETTTGGNDDRIA